MSPAVVSAVLCAVPPAVPPTCRRQCRRQCRPRAAPAPPPSTRAARRPRPRHRDARQNAGPRRAGGQRAERRHRDDHRVRPGGVPARHSGARALAFRRDPGGEVKHPVGRERLGHRQCDEQRGRHARPWPRCRPGCGRPTSRRRRGPRTTRAGSGGLPAGSPPPPRRCRPGAASTAESSPMPTIAAGLAGNRAASALISPNSPSSARLPPAGGEPLSGFTGVRPPNSCPGAQPVWTITVAWRFKGQLTYSAP